jgi:hypothetical protein
MGLSSKSGGTIDGVIIRRKKVKVPSMGLSKEGGGTINGVTIQRRQRYHRQGYHPKKVDIPSTRLSSKEGRGTINTAIIQRR